MDYQEVIVILTKKNKKRLAWFILKYYIENKTIQQIMEEMYIDTVRWFYNMKRRVRRIVKILIEEHKKW